MILQRLQGTHTLCLRQRGVAKEAVGRGVTAQLSPYTMVSLMLQSEQKWILIESFVILLFLPWLRRLVCLPNGRVAADGSPERTDDGRGVREFKLEPTARKV